MGEFFCFFNLETQYIDLSLYTSKSKKSKKPLYFKALSKKMKFFMSYEKSIYIVPTEQNGHKILCPQK